MNFSALQKQVNDELILNILPFWSNQMADPRGGFYGQINGNNHLIESANKGGILNARILWTFSTAFLHLKNPDYKAMADRAQEYILNHFFDSESGGTFWSVTPDGNPADTKKQIYAQAFFIYALSDHYRATANKTSLDKAIELFHLVEKYSFDVVENGYFEAYSRDWKLLEDLRLSAKDANEKKTMNTHLHILEAYTNLYRVWKNEELATRLENLVLIFTDKIVNKKTLHLGLFFDENWNCKSNIVSYGHDIEASWLIDEATRVLGNDFLLKKVQQICIAVAEAACEGLQTDGSLIYECNPDENHTDFDRHWWVQAEATVGFLNTHELTGETIWLERALKCWYYIKENLVDRENGEWFWSIRADGTKNRNDDKAGFWKCPYHNSRMCIEVMIR